MLLHKAWRLNSRSDCYCVGELRLLTWIIECLLDSKNKHSIDKNIAGRCHLRSNNRILETLVYCLKEWWKLPCQNTQHQVLQLFAGPAHTGCPSCARHLAFSCHCFIFVFMCSLSFIFLWLLPATAAFPQTLPEQCSTCMSSQFTTLILWAQYTNHLVRLSLHLFFFHTTESSWTSLKTSAIDVIWLIMLAEGVQSTMGIRNFNLQRSKVRKIGKIHLNAGF